MTVHPSCSCETASGYQLPRFDLRFLLLLTTLSAIWLALFPILTWGSRTVLAMIALTFLFGCWRTRRSVLVLLPCIYLPYAWLILPGIYDWNQYRWQWIAMWPQLPGLIAEIPLHPQPEYRFQFITAMATTLLFLLVVTLGRVNQRWLLATAILVTILSAILSSMAYALFRA